MSNILNLMVLDLLHIISEMPILVFVISMSIMIITVYIDNKLYGLLNVINRFLIGVMFMAYSISAITIGVHIEDFKYAENVLSVDLIHHRKDHDPLPSRRSTVEIENDIEELQYQLDKINTLDENDPDTLIMRIRLEDILFELERSLLDDELSKL